MLLRRQHLLRLRHHHATMNGHDPLKTGPTFTVDQLGIKDIDGYGHVWYGNYLKFFERGLVSFLGGGTVRRVEHLKYKRSVPWGADNSRIESYLVSRPAANTALVYQRWCVGDEADNTNALCLSLVELPPGVGDAVPVMSGSERLPRNGPKLAMAVKNLQTGAVRLARTRSITPGELPSRLSTRPDHPSPADASQTKPPDGLPIGVLRVPRHLFADMVSASGAAGQGGGYGGAGAKCGDLELVDVMDLFEQSRTEVVGGQQGLKAFLDRGLALVVGQARSRPNPPTTRQSGGPPSVVMPSRPPVRCPRRPPLRRSTSWCWRPRRSCARATT